MNSQLIFLSGETMDGSVACSSIIILNDDDYERDQQEFTVFFDSVSTENVLIDDNVTITIEDDIGNQLIIVNLYY